LNPQHSMRTPPKDIVEKAILSASELNVSSRDCYLIELAKNLGINKIYTIDEELVGKVKGVNVENPIPRDIMREYHQHVRKRIM